MAKTEQWISGPELLEIVAGKPFESCEREWRKLLRTMRLRLYHVLPIQEVLKQNRWQEQPNPVAYVRKAARRVARRMGLVGVRRDPEVEVLGCELTPRDFKGSLGGQLKDWRWRSTVLSRNTARGDRGQGPTGCRAQCCWKPETRWTGSAWRSWRDLIEGNSWCWK